MSETKMLAYCGLNCLECAGYIATQNNDDAARAKVAAEWSAMFNADIRPEHIHCDGCKSTTGRQIGHCAVCGIRSCASGKGYDTCAECSDYVCDTLSFVVNNVACARANLEALRG